MNPLIHYLSGILEPKYFEQARHQIYTYMKHINWSNILYLPLDVPKLCLCRNKVIDYFDERKSVEKNNVWNWVVVKPFNGKIRPDILQLFPDLDFKLRQLPHLDYDGQMHIDIREQIVDVRPHQDPDTKRRNEPTHGPTAYKNLLFNDYHESFYLLPKLTNPDIIGYDSRPRSELNPVFPKFPNDSDWFSVSNHNGFHGAFIPPAPYRKMIIFFSGPVNPDLHFDLIRRSLHKYPDYIIYNE